MDAEEEEARTERKRRRCGGGGEEENPASSPRTPPPMTSIPSSRRPRFASRAPSTTPRPQHYSSSLPSGPGAAFERIAERAEALRKPGDDRCGVDVDVADDSRLPVSSSSRGTTASFGAATRSETAAVDAVTRAITCVSCCRWEKERERWFGKKVSQMAMTTSTMDVDLSIEGERRRRENTGNYQLLTATREERMKGRSRAWELGGEREQARRERKRKRVVRTRERKEKRSTSGFPDLFCFPSFPGSQPLPHFFRYPLCFKDPRK